MKNPRLTGGLLALSLILPPFYSSVEAKAPSAEKKQLEERLQSLENELRQVKELMRKDEVETEKAQEEKKKQAVVSAGSEGFSIKSQDGSFALKIRGYAQADNRFYLDDVGDKFSHTFLMRRVRPIFEGTVYKYFDFRIMPDFGEGKVVLQDAYLNVSRWKAFQIRVGKFKEPVGLERLQSATAITFIERGLPTDLVPNRDIGIQIHGDVAGGVFQYAAGVFNGVADGGSSDGDSNDEKDFAGRVFVQPFKKLEGNPAQNLGFGVSGTVGTQNGTTSSTLLPTFKTVGQQTFFSYRSDGTDAGTVVADGQHFRVSPQLYYYWGPLGLLGEYVLSTQNVRLDQTSATIANQAWQVQASYVLTGGKASYSGVVPNHPINPKQGHWGAFELAARYGGLKVDPDAFPVFADPAKSASKAQNWGVAFNWYLNRNLRFALTYDETYFDGGNADGGNRQTERALFNRVQFSF